MGIHPNTEQPEGISVPPGTILGYRVDGRPIYPIAGGAEKDDGPDIEVEVDDAPDDEVDTEDGTESKETPKPKPPAQTTGPEPDEEYVPPSREEWERVRRTLAKRKQEKLDVQRQLNDLRDKHREQETDAEKAIREAAEKAEARYKPIVVKKAARAALIQAGATAAVEGDKEKTEARLARLLKLIDVSDLSVEDDGEVLGLDEQVEGLRAEWPELFEPREKKPKARPTGAPRPAAVEKPKSTAEIHAARILGRA
jgi:hypothetical protein